MIFPENWSEIIETSFSVSFNSFCSCTEVKMSLRSDCISFGNFRVFLPSLEEYFSEAIEQADPEAMVEDEYK